MIARSVPGVGNTPDARRPEGRGQHGRPKGAADLHCRSVDSRGAASPLPRYGTEDDVGYRRYDSDVAGTQQDQRQQHLAVGRFRGQQNQQTVPAAISTSPAAMTFLGPILVVSTPATGANAAAATISGMSRRIAEIGLTFCTVCRK